MNPPAPFTAFILFDVTTGKPKQIHLDEAMARRWLAFMPSCELRAVVVKPE